MAFPVLKRTLFAAAEHKGAVSLAEIFNVLPDPLTYKSSMDKLRGQIIESIHLLNNDEKMCMSNDLLALLHATTAPCSVTEDMYTDARLDDCSSLGRLLKAAQFWGVFHTYNEPAQVVRFVVPKVSEFTLQHCYNNLVEGVAALKECIHQRCDGSDQQNEHWCWTAPRSAWRATVSLCSLTF